MGSLLFGVKSNFVKKRLWLVMDKFDIIPVGFQNGHYLSASDAKHRFSELIWMARFLISN